MNHILRCHEIVKTNFVLRFYPALTIGQKDIAQLLENIATVLRQS